MPDQRPFAEQCGIDEFELSESLLLRTTEQDWLNSTSAPNYRAHLSERMSMSTLQETHEIPANCYGQPVTEIQHYTDRLFRFRITRPADFRFRAGEFVMIGLPDTERPIFRAYSIASPTWDDTLEFYSIKVPDGPLTGKLQKIQTGDTVLLRKKSTGTLVHDALLPGKRLWMFSSGTGIAPFASLVRDPETWEKFNQVILVQTCRGYAELTYGNDLVCSAQSDPLIGEQAQVGLVHYAATTRETSARMGRITSLIENGKIFSDLNLPALTPEDDRVMICGSMSMLNDVKLLTERAGLIEGANNRPGQFVVERAFVG